MCARSLAASLALAFLFVTSIADAQPVTTSRPQITWLGLDRTGPKLGDTSQTLNPADPTGGLAFEPLRLMLLDPFLPTPLDTTSGCLDQMSESKTGSLSLPTMRSVGMNVSGASSWRAPRLTLVGFSRAGCTLDGALGGGAAFTVPIRQDILFVLSGGAIFLPTTRTTNRAVRADVVFQRSGGRSFNVGIGTIEGGPRVSFGGIF